MSFLESFSQIRTLRMRSIVDHARELEINSLIVGRAITGESAFV